MPRNIRTISATWFDDPQIVPVWFIRMAWGIPTGTLYWTTHPADSVTQDLGFGDQVWDGTQVWWPGQFEQGGQNALSISDLTFANAGNTFSDIIRAQTYGVRGVPFDVWLAAYTKEKTGTPAQHQFIDYVEAYNGTGDRAEVNADVVRLALLPYRVTLAKKFPGRRYSLAYDFNWIPKPNFKVLFGSQIIELPTPDRPNTPPVGPGGGGGVGPPGTIGPGGRVPPVLSHPRGTKPRVRGGRKTRTVTR